MDREYMEKPVTLHTIFEARYERGYRYLDRCGDVMVLLESLLGDAVGEPWWPDEMTPTRAKISCPALDIVVSFDAYRMNVESTSNVEGVDFPDICQLVLSTIVNRFDLQSFTRLGYRRIFGVIADSIEDADKLSAKHSPCSNWPQGIPSGFSLVSSEVANVFEDTERSRGWRLSLGPSNKPDAPLQVDERLKLPARYLATGQREALLERLKRQRANSKDPLACLKIDIDFYIFRPDEPDPKEFIAWAETLEETLQQSAIRSINR